MRNLKRALSLTLASVMLLGMMVVGSSAAVGYDDVSKDDNVEAIEVLQAIEVMVGDERGFGPERPVNRAEMAVVMGKLLSLDYNYYSTSCPFNDVYDWAQGWVGACAANGIVSGRGEGVYDPGATVTAVEAASMLMRALGYFKYQNDYADGFEVSTVRQGTIIGIFDGVGSSATEPMTRNQIAQMVLNALQSPVVEPDGNTINLTTPDGTVLTGKVNYVSVTSDKTFARAIGRVGATSIGSTNDGYIVELGERLYDGKLELRDNDNDVFGRPARTWKFNSADIGTYAKKELLVKEYHEKVTGRTVYDELGQSTIRDNALESYLNGHATDIGKVQLVRANNSGLYDASRGNAATTGRGVLTELYLDHDLNKVTIVSIDTYLAQVNSDYNANSETVSLSVYDDFSPRTKLVDLDDVPGIVNLKKDDWVLVNWADESSEAVNKRIIEIGTPEILSDVTASQFSKTTNENKDNWPYNPDTYRQRVESITADGTEYKNNRQSWYEQGTLYDYQQDYLVNKTYDLFMDYYGNFIGATLHSGDDQYVFITGYDRPSSSIAVKTADAAAIFPDGSMQVIKVNVKDTNENIDTYRTDPDTDAEYAAGDYHLAYEEWRALKDSINGKYNENMWYSYTEVDGVYTLDPADGWTLDQNAGADPGEITINCSNVRLTHDGTAHNGSGRSYSEDESIFITVELGDTDKGTDTGVTEVTGIYTGIQNVNLVYKTGQWVNSVYSAKNGYIIAAVVLGEAEGVVDNYAFIRDGIENEKYDAATKTHYWDFKCILNGELVTKTIKSKFANTVHQLDPNTVQELVIDADGYVVRIKDLDDTDPGADDEVYNNYDYINNTNTTGTDTINLEDYDVYDIVINSTFPNATATGVNYQMGDAYCIDLALQQNTLHFDRSAKDVGLHFVRDAKAVVRQYVNNDWTWVEYSSVAQAFNVLTDADNVTTNNATNLKQFNGRIVAVLNSNGEAEWVFFWDYTRANTITNGYSVSFVGKTASDLGKVNISANPISGIAKGETVTFTVTAKDGCKVEEVRIQGGGVLTPNANGVYTLTNVTGNRIIEVTASGEIPPEPAKKVTLSFDLSDDIRYVEIDGEKYTNGNKLTVDEGKLLTATVASKTGASGTMVVKLQSDAHINDIHEITGETVGTPPNAVDEYDIKLTENATLIVTYDVSGLQLDQVQNNFDYRTFDFYYTVDSGNGYMQYFNHADKRDDQKIGVPVFASFGSGYQYNDDVIKQALTDWVKSTVNASNLGFTMNAATGTDLGIAVTGWAAAGTPTIDPGTGIRTFTRRVAVYKMDGSGSLSGTKVGDLTVKYSVLGAEGDVALLAPALSNIASETASAGGKTVTITGTNAWTPGTYKLYKAGENTALATVTVPYSGSTTSLAFTNVEGMTNGTPISFALTYSHGDTESAPSRSFSITPAA